MSAADKVAKLLAGCSGPSDEWPDMGMDYSPPAIVRWRAIEPGADAPLPPLLPTLDQSIAEAIEELDKLHLQFRLEDLTSDIAARLPSVTWADVWEVVCAMPAEFASLLDDLSGWTILADAVAANLGFPIDPDNPLLDPPLH